MAMGSNAPTPPAAAAPAPDETSMGGGEVCIPLKSLEQPDNSEAMQTPAEGDTVNFQVDATVTRIDGENAYVKPIAVNGQPLEQEGEDGGDEEQSEGDALRQMAMSQGQSQPTTPGQ